MQGCHLCTHAHHLDSFFMILYTVLVTMSNIQKERDIKSTTA